ncbi:PREDICTED: transmembrane anterior posterior transformation protein 1 homolog [Priapulus caudatus]|uniref:Transmembrane anterior posterior transformation protein 1 homolog n=1 Tax=Priapulus caudatus TaxID=37621 RepID=A0ABM1EC89_PRICU|nr:PREDICTED: transmembrane anterior posterior transformation protein 1 homolog [Priapulus caudatus]
MNADEPRGSDSLDRLLEEATREMTGRPLTMQIDAATTSKLIENLGPLPENNREAKLSSSDGRQTQNVGDERDSGSGDDREDGGGEEAEAGPTSDGKRAPPSLFAYLQSELRSDYLPETNEATFSAKRARVYAFMKIPREVEKFMLFGFFQCADAFLYVFTYLPLRVLLALASLLFRPFLPSAPAASTSSRRWLQPSEICDVLKGALLVTCVALLNFVDVSVLYHIVRGQAVIKLYIFFNMLEIADKLFSSFGQDILDALFWTATEPRARKREHFGIVPHFALAVVYVFIHATLVLLQATTLNVAFNSHNKALLTIMLSNNFVELKGSVFKRFERNNLFQMSVSDVRERFHYHALLFVVMMRNMTEFAWNADHFWVLIPDMIVVLVAELFVDWLKHAFITKFNEIPAEVYREFTTSLAYDMTTSRRKTAFSDHCDLVSRRMGFIPIPLSVLIARIVMQSVSVEGAAGWATVAVGFLCLLSLKVLVNVVALGRAIRIVGDHRETARASPRPKRSSLRGGALPRRSVSFVGATRQPAPVFERPIYPVGSSVSIASVKLNPEMLKMERECAAMAGGAPPQRAASEGQLEGACEADAAVRRRNVAGETSA